MKLRGRAWVFGDNLAATYFLSGKYDPMVRAGKYRELVPHILEDVDPGFVQKVQPGDLLIAGKAFGTGKHLRGLIEAFKVLGIGGVIAESFAAEWEKVSINSGLPIVVSHAMRSQVSTGELLELDVGAAAAHNLTRGTLIAVNPAPAGMVAILEAGGLEGYTLRRLAQPVRN